MIVNYGLFATFGFGYPQYLLIGIALILMFQVFWSLETHWAWRRLHRRDGDIANRIR